MEIKKEREEFFLVSSDEKRVKGWEYEILWE